MPQLKSNTRSIIFILLLSSLIYGCSFTRLYTRHYPGVVKPLNETAILITMTLSNISPVICQINFVDSKRLTTEGILEVLPGEHNICTSWVKRVGTRGFIRAWRCKYLHLSAKPGHVYILYPKISTHNYSWQPAYRDITNELHAPELKDFVDNIDESLFKKRGGPKISIRTLDKKKDTVSIVGFGEEHRSNLKRWLKKDVFVTYNFNRDIPFIVVEADDGIEYHLEIDQKTGLVRDVIGKNAYVMGSLYSTKGFQKIGSKYAYIGKTIIKSIWKELKNNTYIKIKSLYSAQCGENYYQTLLDVPITKNLCREAKSALVLAECSKPEIIKKNKIIESRISGRNNDEIRRIVSGEKQAMIEEIKRLIDIASNKSKSEEDRKNLTIAVKRINELIFK